MYQRHQDNYLSIGIHWFIVWINCKKVQDMKVFVREENDSKYETAVCPDCVSPEDSKEGINMK